MSGQEKIVSSYISIFSPLTTCYVMSCDENYVIFLGTNIVPSTWKIENWKKIYLKKAAQK